MVYVIALPEWPARHGRDHDQIVWVLELVLIIGLAQVQKTLFGR
jgi:hypothetical protein